MPTLNVSYYGGVQFGVAKDPLGTVQITTSGTTAKTAAAAPAGALVACVWSPDGNHYVNVGAQASVTSSLAAGNVVPLGVERFIALDPGDGIAAVSF